MSKIWTFFSTEGTPRWQLLVGAILLFFAGLAQNEFYYQRSITGSEVEAQQNRIESKIVEIQRHSIDFQTYAGAFVSSVLDATDEVDSRRDALISNILAQDAAVDVSANVLGESISPQVSEYREALRSMKAAAEQVTDVVSMGTFWSAASDLLVARNNLLNALEAYSRDTGA